jgi:phage terminase large subunit-like protein
MTMNPRDNAANLPADYIKELENLPARTRRRFLDGLYGEAAPGALWTEEMIESWRESSLPDMVRVVVAVDPSGAADEDNAENDAIGIIVAGLGRTVTATSLRIARSRPALRLGGRYRHRLMSAHGRQDRRRNQLRRRDGQVRRADRKAQCSVQEDHGEPRQGLESRARSCADRERQDRFGGRFTQLEEELCGFTTHGYTGSDSPNRADAFVFAMSELFPGMVKEKREPKVEAESMYAAGGWQA